MEIKIKTKQINTWKKGGSIMTQFKKAFILLIAGMVIFACNTPLQASQKTDGQYFITHDVLGGGIIPAEEAIDITGTLGQSLAIIGKSDIYDYTTVDVEQRSGFWFARNRKSDLPVVSIMSIPLNNHTNESNEGVFPVKIGLNEGPNTSITYPLTITVGFDNSLTTSSVLGSDYTIQNIVVKDNGEALTVILENDEPVEAFSIKIQDDDKIEDNETIRIKLIDVDGGAIIGDLRTFGIDILANDKCTITGTVRYLGSQTGTLNVLAIDANTGQKVDTPPFTKPWSAKSISENYELELSPGSYTVTAFIDSVGKGAYTQNSWEPCGYTIPVTLSALSPNAQLNFKLDDPDSHFINQNPHAYTGTYSEWIANYPEIGGPDVDYDEDGYTNFQEFINGTNPTQDDDAYAFDGYDPGRDTRTHSLSKPFQIITTNPIKPQVKLGDNGAFLVDINYTTSDYKPYTQIHPETGDEIAATVNKYNGGTTGLGLVVHFDGTVFELAEVTNVLTNCLQNEMNSLTRVEDEDQMFNDDYEDTDKILKIGWVNTNSSWPSNEVYLPIRLCTLKFEVKANLEGVQYGDTSVIRFTAQDMDVRYNFYASPSNVEFNEFNFDIDGNGYVDALTDGLQIIRYMFDLIDGDAEPAVIAEDIGPNAIRTTSVEIYDYIHNSASCLDIDKNGEAKAQSDGLMLLRYMFNIYTPESLIENALGEDAQNTSSEQIIPYIEQYMPKKGTDVITPQMGPE
ncbi:MAG: hypothetical protein OMM_00778 [Candidatus Magnetoglobus multicellularis str. Araruama]|uniref:Uncharacterized protein n=1 Tax=Candidatus Magnetoglobus multicellularis str. Araruama TaxID=890399 RepID=A0A1V1PFK5_9BACT|nr:MAG: hypothetical protein OMM_00778 [Candidatus Magnetoglobus multicellularis str. Araruama]